MTEGLGFVEFYFKKSKKYIGKTKLVFMLHLECKWDFNWDCVVGYFNIEINACSLRNWKEL